MQTIHVISEEFIKASLPPPSNSIKLSLFDQIAPEIYTHLLLFYYSSSTTDLQELPQKLRTSLSKVLNQFYPLAGRIEVSADGILHINCNNKGTVFIETYSNTDLTIFLLSPPINQFKELLPVKTSMFKHSEPLLSLQFTKFLNGYVLGVSISHLIADGASMALFLNRWAETTCEEEEDRLAMPCFTSASTLFPPKPLKTVYQEPKEPLDNSVAIKRFCLPSSSIRRLRESAYERSEMPTRVEAVSALVLRSVLRAAEREIMEKVLVSQVVNFRSRVKDLSDFSIGNLWTGGVSVVEKEGRQGEVEKVLRGIVRGVNEESVRNEVERIFTIKNEVEGEGDAKGRRNERLWIFSSWCRIPLYNSDFGLGEPEWIGCGIWNMKDVCILIDSKDGEGMEVWLWMEREEMDRLENDEEFLSFVSA